MRIPNLVMGDLNADPLLAIGGQLRNGLLPGQQAGLRIWLLGKEQRLQERLRTMVSYSYGTEGGVSGILSPQSMEYPAEHLSPGRDRHRRDHRAHLRRHARSGVVKSLFSGAWHYWRRHARHRGHAGYAELDVLALHSQRDHGKARQ